jgi:hypothetical protein
MTKKRRWQDSEYCATTTAMMNGQKSTSAYHGSITLDAQDSIEREDNAGSLAPLPLTPIFTIDRKCRCVDFARKSESSEIMFANMFCRSDKRQTILSFHHFGFSCLRTVLVFGLDVMVIFGL